MNVAENLLKWITEIQPGLADWLGSLECSGSFCFFKEQGGTISPRLLCAPVFITKICWQSRLDIFPSESLVSAIGKYKNQNGWFVDDLILNTQKLKPSHVLNLVCRKSSLEDVLNMKHRAVIAETRQALCSLGLLNSSPQVPFDWQAPTIDEIKKEFFKLVAWNNPWMAGSRISHLFFFMHHAALQGILRQEERVELTKIIFGELKNLEDRDTGCWFNIKPKNHVAINGAMKVISGLQWACLPYDFSNNLLNYALSQPLKADGCSFLDQLYVVKHVLDKKNDDVARTKLLNFCDDVFECIKNYHRSDGGFSYYTSGSQDSYAGLRIGTKEMKSDLHGTVLITWAIGLLLEVLSKVEKINNVNSIWRSHRT